MMTMTKPICPRCLGYIPNNEMPGAYIGAMSRTDNATEICSDCGTEEAMLDFARGEMPEQDRWPVSLFTDDVFAAARSRHIDRVQREHLD